MNKVVDERLVPNGEYIDALNVRMGSTENAEIGVIENSKGNERLTTLRYIDGTPLTNDAVCIGAIDDTANDTIYWFVHDPSFVPTTPYPAITGKLDLIVSYNVDSQILKYHIVSINDGGNVNTTLNFNPNYVITGVNIVDNLLFFTDDFNQPRFININRFYELPNAIGIDGGLQGPSVFRESLFVVKKPPLSSPSIQPYRTVGGENFMDDRFVSFAYRYRYADGEYSATSQFSRISFSPKNFFFDIKTWLNGGMENEFNACFVTYNSGGPLVVGIDLLFKEANSNIIKVIEKIDKVSQGLIDNTDYTFSFTNSKIFTVLPESELLRLYDNVPRLAKAQTVMGNRIMYGNYLEGYDLIDANGFPCNISYIVSGESQSAEEIDLVSAPFDGSYTIDPTAGVINVTDSVVAILLNGIQCKQGAQFSFDIIFEHAQWTGAAPFPSTTTQQATASFTFVLPSDYNNPTDMVNSAEFQAAIGNFLNIQTVPNSCLGDTFTDIVNCSIPQTLSPLQKSGSGINNINEPATAIVQPITIPIPPVTGDFLLVQLPAMQFVDSLVNPAQIVYEYYKVLSINAVYQPFGTPASLHSNRGYEVGIVYMDEFNRATTTLVSPNNTIYFPCSTSDLVNKIKVTIPLNQRAPSWAKKYKFVIKADKENYDTVYSNYWITDKINTTQTWFLLEGQNTRKVEVGDRLTVKADTSGALDDCVTVTVLEKEAKPESGVGPVNSGSPSGVYMKISNVDLYTVKSPNSFFQRTGYMERDKGEVASGAPNTIVNNAWVSLATHDGTSPITIPAGSKIVISMRMWRNGGMSNCSRSDYRYNRTFYANTDYPDFKSWFEGDGIDTTINSGSNFGDCVSVTNYYNPAIIGPTANNLYSYINSVGPGSVCEFYWSWQDAGAGKLNMIVTGPDACTGGRKPSDRQSKIQGSITIYRAIDTFIFETQPQDTIPDIFFENHMSYDIDTVTGAHLGGLGDTNQDFTTGTPGVIDTKFFNCFSFGNGAESYKAFDSIVGKAFNFGERVTSVAAQDYRAVRRYADITYSGIFNNESNVNKLNEFNLGLINYKALEDSFGRIFRLDGRETDVLVLQEDKISYVLEGKNLLSDAAAGGAITSVPEVLGTQIARSEKYGISFNPESYIHWGYDRYFTDAKRGAVLQLKGNSYSNDQLRVISEQGMRTWFRDVFEASFLTQKLGGFDPYMNEYVLCSNDKPIPYNPGCINCGVSVTLNLSSPDIKDIAQQYCVNLGAQVGVTQIDWNVTSASPGASFQIAALYNGVYTYSAIQFGIGSGSFTFSKDQSNIETADILVFLQGDISITLTVDCPVTQAMNIVEVVLTSDYESGQTIHTEYRYINGAYLSPTQQNLVTFATGVGTPLVSRYNISSGIAGTPGFPSDSSTMFIQTNKIIPDSFNFDLSNDKLRWHRDTVLFANNNVDISNLLALSTTLSVSNLGSIFYGSFTVPVGAPNDYLYLIWDLRDSIGQGLCYSTDPTLACCDCEPCDFDNECVRIAVTNFDPVNDAAITLPNGTCEGGVPVSYTIPPLTTDSFCVNYPVLITLGNPIVTITECGCDSCPDNCSMWRIENIVGDALIEWNDCGNQRQSVYLTPDVGTYILCGKTAEIPTLMSGVADIVFHRCGCCNALCFGGIAEVSTPFAIPQITGVVVNGTVYNFTPFVNGNDPIGLANAWNAALGSECLFGGYRYFTDPLDPDSFRFEFTYICCQLEVVLFDNAGFQFGVAVGVGDCNPPYIGLP
jgi:hypothetical protein